MSRPRQVSNPFSTGGGGFAFETSVQAMYVALMLTRGFIPCLSPSRQIEEIKLQCGYRGYQTENLVLRTKSAEDGSQARLFAQVKRRVCITAKDRIFADVISAAWADFTNREHFAVGTDAIALMTEPLPATDAQHTAVLFELARGSATAREFLVEKVALANYVHETSREKLEVFRKALARAKGCPLGDQELWNFMRSYYIITYDLDKPNGVTESLLRSLLRLAVPQGWDGLWEKLLAYVRSFNPVAGTITWETIPNEIRRHFEIAQAPSEPAAFAVVLSQSNVPVSGEIVVAALIGEWEDSDRADKALIESVAGIDYNSWFSRVQGVLRNVGQLQLSQGHHWKVAERLALLRAVGQSVCPLNLEQLGPEMVRVLTQERPTARAGPSPDSGLGPTLYSSRIRNGVATTLAILANHPEVVPTCPKTTVESCVRRTVRHVLRGTESERWAALEDVLSLLAEAAPDDFLSALERRVQETREDTYEHLDTWGLMWAMQVLAWEEERLVRVVVLLSQLASLDPDKSAHSLPLRSLTTILLPWHPQTFASLEVRGKAIEALRREHPDVAWRLLLTLLPEATATTSGSHKPKWTLRSPDDYRVEVTFADYQQLVANYAMESVSLAAGNVDRLADLVDRIGYLPREAQVQLLAFVTSAMEGSSEEVAASVYGRLQRITLHHRRYPDSPWALQPAELQVLEDILDRFGPNTPALRFGLLFSPDDYELLEGTDEKAWQQLSSRRREAIESLLQNEGPDAVVRLAAAVRSPDKLGSALGAIGSEEHQERILPGMLVDDDNRLVLFAKGFARARFGAQGWGWADGFLGRISSSVEKARLLLCCRFDQEAWGRVRQLDREGRRLYWTEVTVYPEDEEHSLDEAARRLTEYRRPYEALRCVHTTYERSGSFDPSLAVAALRRAVRLGLEPNMLDAYYVVPIIEKLQEIAPSSPSIEGELADVEMGVLRSLGRTTTFRPIVLERRLQRDASFFCEMIQLLYRSDNETANPRPASRKRRRLASNAAYLLRRWKLPPGYTDDGHFDERVFGSWVSCVRTCCEKSGHLEPALLELGRVLRYCSEESPLPRPIAELLNARDADTVREGYRSEWINSRGICLYTGGEEERRLQAFFRDRARSVEVHSRLAATFRELADWYKQEVPLQIDPGFGGP